MDNIYIDGKLLLLTQEEAYQEYLNCARKYVNERIKSECNKHCTDVSIDKSYLPAEVMAEVKTNFNIIDTEEFITITWKKE